MPVYVIAQLRFVDRERYNRYALRFVDVFNQFKGKLLVADESPVLLEGIWPPHKVVIIEFPDEASVKEFRDSPEYQEIATDRKAGADSVILSVRGAVT